MAIVARDAITLARIKDIASVTRYYRLQDSSLPAPAVPTTATPTGWTDTEPAYSADSTTKTLYVCDKTTYTDTTFAYSAVSVYTAYTAAVAAQATADGKNTVYYSATAPSGGTYRNGDIWFDTDDGNAIYLWSSSALQWVKQELGADAIADLAITNGKIANLDGGKITAGSVSTAQLAAGSISTEKLAIGDFTNYATVNENYPNSMNTTADTETVIDSPTSMVTKKVATQRYTPLVTAWGANPFKSGDQVSYSLKAKGATAGTVNLRIVGFSANRESLGNVGANLALTTETQTFSGTVTMPALFNNAAFYSITIYDGRSPASQIYYSEAKFYKKVSGDLIVDGAVTTDKLDANAITAQMISGKDITGGTFKTVLGKRKLMTLNERTGYISDFDDDQDGANIEFIRLQPDNLTALSSNNEAHAKLSPCRGTCTTPGDARNPFVDGKEWGWYSESFFYSPMIFTGDAASGNAGMVATYKAVNNAITAALAPSRTTLTLPTTSTSSAAKNSRAYKSGYVVTLTLQFTMATGTDNSTKDYRLPQEFWPNRQIEFRCANTQTRCFITGPGNADGAGYIRPNSEITMSGGAMIRACVTYILYEEG